MLRRNNLRRQAADAQSPWPAEIRRKFNAELAESRNQYGAIKASHEETVARHGKRSFAAVNVALCEDGRYRQSPELSYSYGGFSGPVFMSTPGYGSLAEAIEAGLAELLQRWHTPFASEPQSVHDELADLRRQIEARLRQPMLF